MQPAKRTLAIVALTTTTLVSCAGPLPPASTPTMQVEALRLYATTSAIPLLVDLTNAYAETHPLIRFDTRSANYQMMVEFLLSGETPYFVSSHLPADSPLWAAPLGQDGIAIITHPGLSVSGLTVDELRAIYQGRITNWNAVGGPNREIIVFTREGGAGIRAEFERLVMGRRATTANARIAPSSASMIESVVRQLGGIGYVSMGYIQPEVRALDINQTRLSVDTVMENRYPLRSTLFIVGLAEPEGEFRRFIGWIQSPEGQAVLGQRYAPLFAPLMEP